MNGNLAPLRTRDGSTCAGNSIRLMLNLRPDGGGGGRVFEHPLLRFSWDSKALAELRAAVFDMPVRITFPRHFWKIWPQVISGPMSQGQIKWRELQKFAVVSQWQWLSERFETARTWYTHYCLQYAHLSHFSIDVLRSGHFRDLPTISQWDKKHALLQGLSLRLWFYITPVHSCQLCNGLEISVG